jgi:hypothetical protein
MLGVIRCMRPAPRNIGSWTLKPRRGQDTNLSTAQPRRRGRRAFTPLDVIRALRQAIEADKGPAQGLRRHRSSLQALPAIDQGIQNFERRLTTKLQEPADRRSLFFRVAGGRAPPWCKGW